MRPYIAAVDRAGLHRRTFDVLVLGGGIAGLTAAIGAARRWRVGLLTKSTFEETTTFLAQGGIAAALGKADSPDLHFDDTMRAGAGLCDAEAVRVLVDEGPERVRELMEICPRFDRIEGEIVLSREGAHSVPRVVHAGGDATGSEVSSALAEALRLGSRVQLYEDEFVIDLLTVDGRCVGALSRSMVDGQTTLNLAMVTILATGGAGQVYARTTNPKVATGDGIAMAYRAGAAIRDLEFVQFHPTGLAIDGQDTVLLITDYNSAIDAIVQRTRAKAIVEGKEENRCQLKYLLRTEDVAVGDVVVTSGLGNFPKGLLVGEIQDVEKKGYGVFQYAELIPGVDLTRLEEVLIITESSTVSLPPQEEKVEKAKKASGGGRKKK